LDEKRAPLKNFLRENLQFIIICFVWIAAGFIFNPLAVVIVSLTALLFYNRNFEVELFIGLLFVLTMSDSRLYYMAWAGDAKTIYIVLFSLATFRNYKSIESVIKLHVYILPFILFAVLCIAFSPIPFTAIQKTASYFLLFASVPNFFSYLYQKYKEDFLKRAVWTSFFIIFIGLLFKYISPESATLVGRLRGLLGNPNGLGIYCYLFCIFLTIIIEFFPDMFTRNEKIFIYGITIISLVYSGARSSLLALILFFVFRYFHRLSPLVGFVLLLMVSVSYELITANFEAIIYSLGLENYLRVETLKEGSGRYVAWGFAWQQIQKNYFIGRGFSFNEYIFRENYGYLLSKGHQGSSAHNSYLTLWLDTGFIGLASFLSGLLGFVFSLSKLSISLFPLLYSVLFSNQFESWLTASLNPFTILFLCSISLIYVAGMERKTIEKKTETGNEPDPATVAMT
jgi:hypothetical protein